jgi:hypothetical protein
MFLFPQRSLLELVWDVADYERAGVAHAHLFERMVIGVRAYVVLLIDTW